VHFDCAVLSVPVLHSRRIRCIQGGDLWDLRAVFRRCCLALSCLPLSCISEAFDASEAGIIVLYCRVSFLLSCLVVHSLARPKHSMHLRRGSLRLREMYCALFHPSCLVSRVLYTSLSSIVLHFRSIRCIRGRGLRAVRVCFVCLVLPSVYLAPSCFVGRLFCTVLFRSFCSVLDMVSK
jgi:hypothetical protein